MYAQSSRVSLPSKNTHLSTVSARTFLITPCARLFLDTNQTGPKMFQTFTLLIVSRARRDI